MRRLLCLAALLLLALPAHAAGPTFLAPLQPGDADLNLPLQSLHANVAYLDGNGNGRPDAALPDENVYLDMDASGTVSYGDLRLTSFGPYAAGTVVELVHLDVGRVLSSAPNAWFGQANGAWILDMDASGTLSAGDIRFASTPVKAHVGDADLGATLAKPSGAQPGAFGWTGTGGTSPRDPAGIFYVDLDSFSAGGGRTSPGDLRITPLPAIADTRLAGTPAAAPGGAAAAAGSANAGMAAWRGLDWVLVGLGALNLVGLVAIARRLNELRGPPRNPFK